MGSVWNQARANHLEVVAARGSGAGVASPFCRDDHSGSCGGVLPGEPGEWGLDLEPRSGAQRSAQPIRCPVPLPTQPGPTPGRDPPPPSSLFHLLPPPWPRPGPQWAQRGQWSESASPPLAVPARPLLLNGWGGPFACPRGGTVALLQPGRLHFSAPWLSLTLLLFLYQEGQNCLATHCPSGSWDPGPLAPPHRPTPANLQPPEGPAHLCPSAVWGGVGPGLSPEPLG